MMLVLLAERELDHCADSDRALTLSTETPMRKATSKSTPSRIRSNHKTRSSYVEMPATWASVEFGGYNFRDRPFYFSVMAGVRDKIALYNGLGEMSHDQAVHIAIGILQIASAFDNGLTESERERVREIVEAKPSGILGRAKRGDWWEPHLDVERIGAA